MHYPKVRMNLALDSALIYKEIVAHANLNLMTKLTDYSSYSGTNFTSKEQDKALRRAWISNTEVQLLEGKGKSAKPI